MFFIKNTNYLKMFYRKILLPLSCEKVTQSRSVQLFSSSFLFLASDYAIIRLDKYEVLPEAENEFADFP